MIPYQKHPRTYHFSFSQGVQSDDKLLTSDAAFQDEEVVAWVKLDGENTSLYSNYSHARSIDSRHNFTRDWVKKLHSVLKHQIPEDMALIGENLWAEHAIRYPDGFLQGYFYLFAILERGETYLSFDELVAYADLLDLPLPGVLYRGPYDKDKLAKLAQRLALPVAVKAESSQFSDESFTPLVDSLDLTLCEGFVTRVTRAFSFDEYSKCVAKYVRAGHVQEDAEHWLKNARQNGALAQVVKPGYMGG